MIKKRKAYVAEPPKNTEFDNTLRQLDRILEIRKNRKEKLEAKTRELKKALADKEGLLELQKEIAKKNEIDSHDEIKALKKSNTNKVMKVDDILFWQEKEISLRKGIVKSYNKCDEILDQKDVLKFKLDTHLGVYRQAVMDYEKIDIIKKEIEKQRDEQE